TIDWGDGTTDTGAAVTITGGSGANFTVSGTHTYLGRGPFTTKVTLTDDSPGTATSTVTGSANVAPATPTVTVSDGGIYNGNAFNAVGSAVGIDGHTAVSGSFSYT